MAALNFAVVLVAAFVVAVLNRSAGQRDFGRSRLDLSAAMNDPSLDDPNLRPAAACDETH